MNKPKQTEAQLHKMVCDYIRTKYPNVIFNSDLSGIKLTIGQATKLKSLRSSRAFPDIVIYEPRGTYHGLFIELKAEGTKLLKKDGSPATEHIKEQELMMRSLIKKGYLCYFAIGFNAAKFFIDKYLKK